MNEPISTSDPSPVLETDRLQLYDVQPTDAEFMLRLLNDEGFHRFIGDRGVRSLDDAIEYLRKQQERFAGTSQRLLVVRLRGHHEALGVCSLLHREGLEHPDIGFAFLPAGRGQGYALEATRATLTFARDHDDLRSVVAIVAPDNLRSISLLKKLGFVRQGTVRLPAWPDDSDVYVQADAG